MYESLINLYVQSKQFAVVCIAYWPYCCKIHFCCGNCYFVPYQALAKHASYYLIIGASQFRIIHWVSKVNRNSVFEVWNEFVSFRQFFRSIRPVFFVFYCTTTRTWKLQFLQDIFSYVFKRFNWHADEPFLRKTHRIVLSNNSMFAKLNA